MRGRGQSIKGEETEERIPQINAHWFPEQTMSQHGCEEVNWTY